MKNWQYWIGAAAFLLLISVSVRAALQQTDNTAVAVPSDNGTSTYLNVTTRMQQYVGFFGRIWYEVRLNFTTGSGTLYNKSVTEGKIYFYKAGATPTGAILTAVNNSDTDGNFSLTGYYATGNHYVLNSTVCGVTSVDHLNTTDNYAVGIFKDQAATPNYFLCTDITQKSSTNGFNTVDGNVHFEVVVPKTSTYTSYDVWIDSE
ncbi:MAG: hypothetical protein ABH863_02050 [Candidatus Micrarchaeota archaeon]